MGNWYVWCVALFVSLGGFIFGYDAGSINGVKDMIGYRRTFNISSAISEDSSNGTNSCDSQDDVETAALLGLIVSLFSVGSLLGAFASGFFTDKVGRKPVIIFSGCLTMIGGIIHTSAVSLWMVLLSRFIGGFSTGLQYQSIPLYMAEISPEQLRGRLLCFFTVYAVTGGFVATVVNVGLKNLVYGWRISLSVLILLGSLLALGMCLLPRSPRWLVKKHKDAKALKVLTKIYQDEARAQTQLDEIKGTVTSTKEPFLETLKYILQWKILQRLLIGISAMVLGRFTGLNFIGYFSVSLFCGIGLPGFAVSIALSGVCVVSLLLAVFIVDKLGRKPLFLIGLSVMVVSHVASAVIILIFKLEEIGDGEVSVSQTVAGYFVLVLQCLFLGSATLSVGNVTWIMINEMFPIKGRGFMTSLCNAAFWISLIAVNQISPVMVSSPFNIAGTLLFFAAVAFTNLIFILLAVPETKGYTLEGIEELFSKPWSVRTNPLFYLCCGCSIGSRGRSYHLLDTPEGQQLETITENGRTAYDSPEDDRKGGLTEIDGREEADLADSVKFKDCDLRNTEENHTTTSL